MNRTSLVYDKAGEVESITIDGRSVDEYAGRPIALCLHNNNQEIAKAVIDTKNLLTDFSDAVDLAVSEHPGDKALKGYYERVVNITGIFHFRLGDFSAAQEIFELMLSALCRFESHGSIKLHKGMAFHNIAISQLLHGAFDQAVANFFRASDEDTRSGVEPSQSFALKVLEKRYTQPLVASIETSIDPVFVRISGKPLGNGVRDLLNLLNPECSLLLLQVWKSLEINKPRDNLYSRCRAFDNAKNVALVVETFLRWCCENTNDQTVRASYARLSRATLREILRCLFQNRASWFGKLDGQWGKWTQFSSSNLPADLDNSLSDLLTKPLLRNDPQDELVRSILVLGLLRNFTAHEFDPNCSLTMQFHEDAISRMLTVLLIFYDELTTGGIINPSSFKRQLMFAI